eukprot:gene15357-32507_t
MDDTPRSNFATPRDDRFFSPRAFSNPNSSSDEWITPRVGNTNASNGMASDTEYDTPRGGEYDNVNQSNIQSERWHKNNNDATAAASIRSHKFQSVPEDKYSNNNDDEDETVAINLMNGITSEDVEDIFSYARHGRLDDIERLFDRGIPVNVRDTYGNTILTIACQNGNKRIAKAALRRGADINARNFKGNTPLHYCIHYGYRETLGNYLMEKGADRLIRNNEGKTCFDGC